MESRDGVVHMLPKFLIMWKASEEVPSFFFTSRDDGQEWGACSKFAECRRTDLTFSAISTPTEAVRRLSRGEKGEILSAPIDKDASRTVAPKLIAVGLFWGTQIIIRLGAVEFFFLFLLTPALFKRINKCQFLESWLKFFAFY